MNNQNENNDLRSITVDEVTAVFNRMKIIMDNSENPVEVFLANHMYNVLGDVLADLNSILANPNLELIAEQFVKKINDSKNPDLPK